MISAPPLKAIIAFGIGFAVLGLMTSTSYNLIAQSQKGDTSVEIPNHQIDEQAFVKSTLGAMQLRKQRRLTEAQFHKFSQRRDVIVLDARGHDRYQLVHVRGAINLPFTDINFDSLAKTLPNKNAIILIYCNNNFGGNLDELKSKSAGAALNLSTFSSLYDYGYRNIYELGPVLDVRTTQLPLAGTNAESLRKGF